MAMLLMFLLMYIFIRFLYHPSQEGSGWLTVKDIQKNHSRIIRKAHPFLPFMLKWAYYQTVILMP